MFTLYQIRFCSVSKVAPAQCEQEYVHRCIAKIALFQNCSHSTGSIRITSQLPFQISIVHCCLDNSQFTNERFLHNFYSNKSIQTMSGSFQKPIRHRTLRFRQRNGGEQSCFETKTIPESAFAVLTGALSD